MNFIVFLIILFLIWLMFGQQIKRWLAGFMARRTEDYIRRATGMPPRPGSREHRRQQRQQEQNARQAYSSQSSASSSRRRSRRSGGREPLIPKEYAEDVEFVETVSYSSTTTIGATGTTDRSTIYHESQVSDVEWEEIRISRK